VHDGGAAVMFQENQYTMNALESGMSFFESGMSFYELGVHASEMLSSDSRMVF
jgi:hypothetical protein